MLIDIKEEDFKNIKEHCQKLDIPLEKWCVEKLLDAFCSETSFHCPQCGSSHFGTVNALEISDDVPQIFRCHDEFGRGCSWTGTWHPYETA